MFVSYHKTNFSVGNVHIGMNPLQTPASAHASSHGNNLNYRLHFPLLGQWPKPSSLIGSPAICRQLRCRQLDDIYVDAKLQEVL
ncbi:hypothetical protein M378DRAFT_167906, partial [Amanita muscaria Koide BX008]